MLSGMRRKINDHIGASATVLAFGLLHIGFGIDQPSRAIGYVSVAAAIIYFTVVIWLYLRSGEAQ